jgi:hypothetical protein
MKSEPLRNDIPAAERTGRIHRDLWRWLRALAQVAGRTVWDTSSASTDTLAEFGQLIYVTQPGVTVSLPAITSGDLSGEILVVNDSGTTCNVVPTGSATVEGFDVLTIENGDRPRFCAATTSKWVLA